MLCTVSAAGCGKKDKENIEPPSQQVSEQTDTNTPKETSEETDTVSEPVQFGSEEDIYEFPYQASDYVTVGKYTDLTVDDVKISEVSDADIDAEIKTRIMKNDALQKNTSGIVSDGDTVNISYTGKIDGREFISKEDFNVRIGSGNLDQTFEASLVGKKIGDTFAFHNILSSNYGENAGKEAEFTVTIHSVDMIPELTDSLAAKLSNQKYQTVKEFKDSIKEDLKKDAEEKREEIIFNEILSDVAEGSSFTGFPITEPSDADLEKEAAALGMTVEQFMAAREGITEPGDEPDAELMLNLLIQAIAEREDITITEEDFDAVYESLIRHGFSSKEEVDMDFDTEDLARLALKNKVSEFLIDNNNYQ